MTAPTGSCDEFARSKRLVMLSDDELECVSLDTKRRINWRRIILSAKHNPECWQWQELENGFTMFTRQDAGRVAVLVVGLVPGCVAEVLNVLQSPSSEQFAQRMRAIFKDELRDGAVIHRVDLDDRSHRSSLKQSEMEKSELVELMVKRVTFNKASWFSKHEEWCYLNAVYRSKENTVVEKIMTTLDSTDVLVDAFGGGKVGSSVNAFHNVVCGYLLRADTRDLVEDGEYCKHQRRCGHPPVGAMSRVTRVCFYAKFDVPNRDMIQVPLASATNIWRRYVEASTKTIKSRLVKLGTSTARLTTLVRRQRLGLQAVLSTSRFMAPMQTHCKLCKCTALMLKVCRLCGHDVCSKCSAKYERARPLPGRKPFEVSLIRACTHCINQVDQAEYKALMSCWLLDKTRAPLSSQPRKPASAASYTRSNFAREVEARPASPASSLSIRSSSVHDLGTVSQLEILCDLAVRELGCSAVLVSVVQDDQFAVVASNVAYLQDAEIPRSETLFAMIEHRVMIVSHAQTTLCFSAADSLMELQVRFYCADPVIGEDDQVIGAMCCLHEDPLKVTHAQIAKFKLLARRASRVLRVETTQQRSRTESVTSSTYSSAA